MVSQPMQDAIDAFLAQRDAGAGTPAPPIDQLRAGFTPAGTAVYPVPDDVEVTLAGDSAGAGLALGLLVALRDAGEPLPAAAALMSPAIDLTGSGDSMTERAGRDPVFSPDVVRLLGSLYLASADPMNPLASPLFAPLAGRPRLLVQAGTEEILFSDAQRLEQFAAEAGVDVTLQLGEGLPHVYQAVLEAPRQ